MSLCPKCGKPGKGLCLDCFLEERPIDLGEVKIFSCKCGKISYKGRWNPNLEDVSNAIRRGVKIPVELKLEEVKVKPEVRENQLHLEVEVEGVYSGEEFKRKLGKNIKIQKTTCPTCSRKSSGYYEAILQFRCKVPDLVIDESQTSKVEEVRGGVDYYLLSNNQAKAIASQLKRRGYKIKSSKKIFSRRDGREVYRVSYSIKEK